MKKELLAKYRNKKLAYYHSEHIAKLNNMAKTYFQINDFLNKKKLINFFDNLADSEASITKSGFLFLEEYYGIEELIKILKNANPNFPYDKNVKNLKGWLLEVKKYSDEDIK